MGFQVGSGSDHRQETCAMSNRRRKAEEESTWLWHLLPSAVLGAVLMYEVLRFRQYMWSDFILALSVAAFGGLLWQLNKGRWEGKFARALMNVALGALLVLLLSAAFV